MKKSLTEMGWRMGGVGGGGEEHPSLHLWLSLFKITPKIEASDFLLCTVCFVYMVYYFL